MNEKYYYLPIILKGETVFPVPVGKATTKFDIALDDIKKQMVYEAERVYGDEYITVLEEAYEYNESGDGNIYWSVKDDELTAYIQTNEDTIYFDILRFEV